ncbi:hypothetical protein LCGC14_0165060 [marine sediment metagenome]|uniref:Uncharacterized protein n=1 Tax=marine sediment metagenome TaxID=412755 RepID=A0A0F9VAT3_9ZZZZ
MKFLSLEDQTDVLTAAMQSVFGTALSIEIIDHPDPLEDPEVPQDAIQVDNTYVISCGEHMIEVEDCELGSSSVDFSYLLERNVYLPGTREIPPDWDVVEIGPYRNFYELVRAMVSHLVADRLDCVFQSIEMDELVAEVAKESTCQNSGS